MSFGKYLATKRTQSGYKSQRQLALDAGISNATISRIEDESQKPQPETLKLLARFLKDVSYTDLLAQAGYIDESSDEFDSSANEEFEIAQYLCMRSIRMFLQGKIDKEKLAEKVTEINAKYNILEFMKNGGGMQ